MATVTIAGLQSVLDEYAHMLRESLGLGGDEVVRHGSTSGSAPLM